MYSVCPVLTTGLISASMSSKTGCSRGGSYKGLNVLAETPDKIMFKSVETVEGADGTCNTIGIEFILQKEADGVWRVSQERVLPDDELDNDIRRGAL